MALLNASRAFCVPAFLCLWLTGELTILNAVQVILLQFIINYAFAWLYYHRVHSSQDKKQNQDAEPQAPPDYITVFPDVGPLLSIVWDHSGFIKRLGTKPVRISLFGLDIFHFQDRQILKLIFRQGTLASPMAAYKFAVKGALGVTGKAYLPYLHDDSGPFPKPHPQSSVPPHARIDYVTTSAFARGLTGPGMLPTVGRFVEHLTARVQELPVADEWVEMDDLAHFFRQLVGASTLHAILGPTMLGLHPNFVEDLWKFDSSLESFKLPSFLIPGVCRLRESLVGQFKSWYKYAREHFDESMISEDGDGDPIWGSSLIRHRQKTLLQVEGQDDDSLARVDLGLAWASIGNVVPSATCAAFHVFKDPELLARVRDVADKHCSSGGDWSRAAAAAAVAAQPDIKALAADPLLLSVYAETLRLYIKVHAAFSSPHEDITLGQWVLPKGGIALISSEPAHMDADFWNTQGGKHPLQSFWADRFVIDPSDPSSGPMVPELRENMSFGKDATSAPKTEPYFSTEGCEGAWLPYGGGHSMCPGRFFSKHVMTVTCALLAREFDIEPYSSSIQWSSRRYGIGALLFKGALPFRIRRRQHAQKVE